jgi:NitT/TauT family transport system permease protein
MRYFELRKNIPRWLHISLGIIPFIIVFGGWAALSYGEIVKPIFLPTPTKVIQTIVFLFTEQGLLADIFASVFRVLSSFFISAAIAVPLGIFMGSLKFIEGLFTPFTAFMRYMPVAAFIPLLILWVGIGHLQKIILLFIGIFFYLLVLVTNVVASVKKEYLDAAYTLGATKTQTLVKVIVPASLPGIFDSLRAMMGVGWTYIVVVELVAAESGIGKRIMEAQRFLHTADVIGCIIIIGIIGITFDLIFRLTYPLLFKWTE